MASCDNVCMEFKPYGRGFVVRTHFTNTTGKTVAHLGELVMLEGLWKESFEKVVNNVVGWFNGNVTNDMRTRVATWQPIIGQCIESGDFAAIRDSSGQHVMLGFATYERYFNAMRIAGDGYFAVRQLMESHPFEPGETITTDWFYIGLCDDFVHGIPEFMDITADFIGLKLRDFEVPVGCCSWYYYFSKVSPDTLRENIAFFQDHQEEIPIRYFQIDDGWHAGWGDWEENEKFACGMKQVADEIKEAGFLPGIWVAPLGADTHTRLWKEHPDWFVKRWDSDELWHEASMDMTNPEVQAYIKTLFHKLSYEWGFRYIKIDIVIDRAARGGTMTPKPRL